MTSTEYVRDLTGHGAFLHGGRWNNIGNHVLYTAQSSGVAILEVLVHLRKTMVPPDLSLAVIRVPRPISLKSIAAKELPAGWDDPNPPSFLAKIGDDWLVSKESLVLQVPSIFGKVESNFLINPAHQDFSRVKIVKILPFEFDPRLLK